MDPRKWGPGLWEVVHSLPLHHNSVKSVRDFYAHLAVPCPKCQRHLDEFREARPVSEITDMRHAKRWSVDLHNSVNKKLGKRVYSVSECYGEGTCNVDPSVNSKGHVF